MSTLVLCTCSDCAGNIIIDSNGQQQNGRFIARRTHYQHRRVEHQNQSIIFNNSSPHWQQPLLELIEQVSSSSLSTSETTYDEERPPHMDMTMSSAFTIFHPCQHGKMQNGSGCPTQNNRKGPGYTPRATT
ncbi:hypothetical protein CROQUDRAFT_89616 [Cronartium quercuum f. sp. fusiforme G11]|uniref:Uncharacterized protein n=1 Tax=Cronartium quercuum f. sp. fusiforme G11 TaxID=708437 RepID=A0A9P6NT37_9BASI|nr:hypothetical protein CROQUDRAFT_89616 [Cronartium quercuum f. sp. fusiforme G11]